MGEGGPEVGVGRTASREGGTRRGDMLRRGGRRVSWGRRSASGGVWIEERAAGGGAMRGACRGPVLMAGA